MSRSIDYDKMCLYFNKRREESILIYLNQREIEIIFVKFFIRHNERELKHDF